jgi:sensor c-di-GMP phosphodiesterase-like protein
LTAEGVETKTQYQLIKTLGCDSVQGYLFAKALSAVQLDQLYQSRFADGARLLASKAVNAPTPLRPSKPK